MDNEMVKEVSRYYVETKSTFRDTARKFGCSKSTVDRIVNNFLRTADYELFIKAQKIKNKNREEAHARGGSAKRTSVGRTLESTIELTLKIIKMSINKECSVAEALKIMHIGSCTYYKCLNHEIKSLYPSLYKEYVESMSKFKKERCLKNLSVYAFTK